MDNQKYRASANLVKSEVDKIISKINSVKQLIASSYQGEDNDYQDKLENVDFDIEQLKEGVRILKEYVSRAWY